MPNLYTFEFVPGDWMAELLGGLGGTSGGFRWIKQTLISLSEKVYPASIC